MGERDPKTMSFDELRAEFYHGDPLRPLSRTESLRTEIQRRVREVGMEKDCCGTCLIWEYSGTDFSKPDGQKMSGWCRVLKKQTRQDFLCDSFYSRSKQEQEYLSSRPTTHKGERG